MFILHNGLLFRAVISYACIDISYRILALHCISRIRSNIWCAYFPLGRPVMLANHDGFIQSNEEKTCVSSRIIGILVQHYRAPTSFCTSFNVRFFVQCSPKIAFCTLYIDVCYKMLEHQENFIFMYSTIASNGESKSKRVPKKTETIYHVFSLQRKEARVLTSFNFAVLEKKKETQQ